MTDRINDKGSVWCFGTCDARPSEQICGNSDQIHTMSIITFPNEEYVKAFLEKVENKIVKEYGKKFPLRHWKRYRNTERGERQKIIVLKSLLATIQEDKDVSLWVLWGKEKKIFENQHTLITNLGFDKWLTIEGDIYHFGPFRIRKGPEGKMTSEIIDVKLHKNAGAPIIWVAANIIRCFKKIKEFANKQYPNRPFKFDLRYDRLPNDNPIELERISCLFGLLCLATKDEIYPKVNIIDKNHLSVILADNIAGGLGEYYEDTTILEKYTTRYGPKDGIYAFQVI